MAQITSDFLVDMTAVTNDALQCVRKAAEVPPRVSIYDVLGLVTGYTPTVCSHTFLRLQETFPEVGLVWSNFKLQGRGQRHTPVTDA